jgi:anti-anti-sigma factor
MYRSSFAYAATLAATPGPVHWAGGQAVVVVLPEHIGASNAGQVREELLSVINRSAQKLIADMTATVSCDHAGADAVIRAWQRAAVSGTELRLVVTARTVSQVLDQRGLDRLVSVYPSLHAAIAAGPSAAAAVAGAARSRRAGQPRAASPAAAPADGNEASLAPAAELLEALQDAVVLADGDGMIAAASARMEGMFGYGPGELPGLPAGSLVPAWLQEAHRGHRAAWAHAPRTRPMAACAQLAGLRKDGTTFPVRVSLTPVTTAAGPFTLAAIRDITRTGRLGDLAALARDAATAQQEHLQLMDTVITSLFHAGLSLQTAMDSLPADADRRGIEEAAGDLDDIIRQIRDTAFTARGRPGLPSPAPAGDDR